MLNVAEIKLAKIHSKEQGRARTTDAGPSASLGAAAAVAAFTATIAGVTALLRQLLKRPQVSPARQLGAERVRRQRRPVRLRGRQQPRGLAA